MSNVYNKQGRKKQIYTEFTVAHYSDVYPLTVGELSKKFQTYQPELYYDPLTHGNTNGFRYQYDDFLKYCYFDIIAMEPNTDNMLNSSMTRQFDNVNGLVGTISNIASESGGFFQQEVKLRVYNYIDNEIPTISRIGGYNSWYSALCTTSRFQRSYSLHHAKDLHPSGGNYAYYREFIIDAWQNLFGINITTDYDANPELWQRTVWIQPDKHKKLYNLPKAQSNATIQLSSPSERYIVDITTGSPYTPVPPVGVNNLLFDNRMSVYMDNSTSISSYNAQWTNYPKSTLRSRAYSSLMCYSVSDGNYRSIYIKPLGGIDTFQFPKFDSNIYRLEAVFDRIGKRSRWKIIDVPTGTGSENYSSRIRRDQLWAGGKRTGASTKSHAFPHNGWDIRFYLRNLETNLVSSLSEIGITGTVTEKGRLSGLDYYIKRF